ncbi:phosphatidylinositol-specific phospholipase C domain-containing protein [Streptomyces noursei]|uniref:phosphatidylinositol-specific phospholipase C domain-containing protein n=1 Tax=Streptomyces noursei TaxID=1971 RepID=UPI001678BFF3|nr:phosphatidylinositol-specific phospholipase C domain-containing protein [Streptomyces noursei]MCZ1021257.1 phosphatidylinositol-specific phospholipase C domain-containing protein [Streptomyces noursei]GGX57258.1 hypothetical protein GCM10010341_91700 [Streptomyces noursei]
MTSEKYLQVLNEVSAVTKMTGGRQSEAQEMNETLTGRLADISGKSWMNGLPDEQSLARITIPGSHESCATVDAFDGEGKCQRFSLSDQLEDGVRYLDIRCRAVQDDGGFKIDGYDGLWIFTIHHGPIYENLVFGQVVAICQDFLKRNDSEAILMCIKQEYSSVEDGLFNGIFDCYRRKYDQLFRAESSVPTVGSVRGKIVVITRNAGLPGISWAQSMSVEDHSEDPGREAKYRYVIDHMNAAMVDETGTLYATNTSAHTSPDDDAFWYAQYLFLGVWNSISDFYNKHDHNWPMPLGIVAMDYAGPWEEAEGADLVPILYGCNGPSLTLKVAQPQNGAELLKGQPLVVSGTAALAVHGMKVSVCIKEEQVQQEVPVDTEGAWSAEFPDLDLPPGYFTITVAFECLTQTVKVRVKHRVEIGSPKDGDIRVLGKSDRVVSGATSVPDGDQIDVWLDDYDSGPHQSSLVQNGQWSVEFPEDVWTPRVEAYTAYAAWMDPSGNSQTPSVEFSIYFALDFLYPRRDETIECDDTLFHRVSFFGTSNAPDGEEVTLKFSDKSIVGTAEIKGGNWALYNPLDTLPEGDYHVTAEGVTEKACENFGVISKLSYDALPYQFHTPNTIVLYGQPMSDLPDHHSVVNCTLHKDRMPPRDSDYVKFLVSADQYEALWWPDGEKKMQWMDDSQTPYFTSAEDLEGADGEFGWIWRYPKEFTSPTRSLNIKFEGLCVSKDYFAGYFRKPGVLQIRGQNYSDCKDFSIKTALFWYYAFP